MSAPRVLSRLMLDAAARRPDGIAAYCDRDTLTYGQLTHLAQGLAHLLISGGLRQRDRVAVWLGKGTRVPVAFHGTLAAGATLVPIDPKSPIEHVIRILQSTGATQLVTEEARADAVGRALVSCPAVRQVIGLESLDGDTRPCIPWSTVVEAATGRTPDVRIVEVDPAYILHTSGTTGRPKLILHTHDSATSFVEWAAAAYGLTADDRITNHASHHTCFATFDFYAAARAAATTIIVPPAALMMPASLSALLEEQRVSVWYSVPAALVQLSLRGELERRDLGALRWVLFAGEAFPIRHLQRLREQLPRARFSHVYGSTEVNICTYYHLPDGEPPAGPLPIGQPCWTSAVLVADAEMQPVADGTMGELWVRGSTVMAGYWDDPEQTRHALVRRPGDAAIDGVYYRTGDRASVLPDGNLAFGARADRQVKIRGHRVELDEVEGAMLSLPAIDEAAAFTVPDGEGSSSLRAAVVSSQAIRFSERELLAQLGSLLPPYALPAQIAFMSSLPRTPTGKVDVAALAASSSQQGRPQ